MMAASLKIIWWGDVRGQAHRCIVMAKRGGLDQLFYGMTAAQKLLVKGWKSMICLSLLFL